MSRTDAQMRIRIPHPLQDSIRRSAKANYRTLNAEIVFHLERALVGSEAATGEQAANHAPAAVTETQSVGPDRINTQG